MSKYKLKKGNRKRLEYDLMIYYDDKMTFKGSFVSSYVKSLTKIEKKIFKVIELAIQSLNEQEIDK